MRVLSIALAGAAAAVLFALAGVAASAAGGEGSMVIRDDCEGRYLVVGYRADGSTVGTWKKQLSEQGTIYTAGETWTLAAGDAGEPDRFISESGQEQEVVPCEAPPAAAAQRDTASVSRSGGGQNSALQPRIIGYYEHQTAASHILGHPQQDDDAAPIRNWSSSFVDYNPNGVTCATICAGNCPVTSGNCLARCKARGQ